MQTLNVFVVPDGSVWFAQAEQIDYAAQGDSIAEAQLHFELGLASTIIENIKRNAGIQALLVLPPEAEIAELKMLCHTSTIHPIPSSLAQLPFDSINYWQ